MSITPAPKVHRATTEVAFPGLLNGSGNTGLSNVGKWVVLDGDRLIGVGDDPRPLVNAAREQGVKLPFVEFIRDDSEPFVGGWM
ncbi:MAG: DUF5678 domain-containing protein [Blastocatellia bacterium]